MSAKSIILTSANNTSTVPNVMRLILPFPYKSDNDTIALDAVSVFYSWRNITSAFNNKTFSYIFNSVTYPIVLPDGFYSISDLNGYLQFVMTNNGHYLMDSNGQKVFFLSLQINQVYYGITVTATQIPTVLGTNTNPRSVALSGTCPQLVVTGAGFGTIIGYGLGTFPTLNTSTQSVNSTLIPQIHPVTSVNVSCNWVNNSYFNAFPSIISTFSPSEGTNYGSLITYQPINHLYYPVTSNHFYDMQLTFTDQNGNALGILDTNIVCSLYIIKGA